MGISGNPWNDWLLGQATTVSLPITNPEIELNKLITQEDDPGAPRPYIQDAKMKKFLIVG